MGEGLQPIRQRNNKSIRKLCDSQGVNRGLIFTNLIHADVALVQTIVSPALLISFLVLDFLIANRVH